MSVIVFSNQKGGPGKTTLAVLYAMWLAEKCGRRVCVIDLDSQRNASKALRAFDSSVAAHQLFASEAISLTPREDATITLVAGSRQLVDVERAAPDVVLPAFRHHVAALDRSFDDCVIDTPPSLGLRMSAALMAADHAVCPIELEEFSIDGVTDMLKTVFGVRQRYNPRLRLAGLLANRFNPHSARQKAALSRLLADYADFIVPTKISTRSAIPEALAQGLAVWRLPKSAARDASVEVLHAFELLRGRMAEDSRMEAAA